MKKFIFMLFLLSSVSAFSATYKDGTYRGYYISKGEMQVEVQFDLKDDVIEKISYRTLFYKGKDWLKEEEFIKLNKGYMGTLDYVTGKKADDVTLDALYNPADIETIGATVRAGKVRFAIQSALNVGPYRLPKK